MSRRQRAIEEWSRRHREHRIALSCWMEIGDTDWQVRELDALIEVTSQLAEAQLSTDAEWDKAHPLPIWRRVTERLQEMVG